MTVMEKSTYGSSRNRQQWHIAEEAKILRAASSPSVPIPHSLVYGEGAGDGEPVRRFCARLLPYVLPLDSTQHRPRIPCRLNLL